MNNNLKCLFGMHEYEIIDTKELKNSFNINVGDVIISRCKHCGKIKNKQVYTNNQYTR